jgi:Xaa-Pro aminopeptidase
MTITLIAGIPATNDTFFHAIRFAAGDPAALIDCDGHRLLIIRDIEMARAKASARADEVRCPADFMPNGGLSGDRETATAQATAEAIHQRGVDAVRSDRTLPLSFVAALGEVGIAVNYDADLGVQERRVKDEAELDALRTAQDDGEPLTSERVRTLIDIHLLAAGYQNPTSIVAGGPQGADCHNVGQGALRTSEPIIIDVFPRSKSTKYNGDCTRMVVHGEVPPAVERMHAAVLAAKIAGEQVAKAGVTGEGVNAATTAVIIEHGYELGLPTEDADAGRIAMVHGTGHGVGLSVHEPPLLDVGGPPLLAGDVITIEPGLYGPAVGGLRLEDMVVVTESGCEDLGSGLQLGMCWT